MLLQEKNKSYKATLGCAAFVEKQKIQRGKQEEVDRKRNQCNHTLALLLAHFVNVSLSYLVTCDRPLHLCLFCFNPNGLYLASYTRLRYSAMA
jgi:hypothetical protein